jgi:HPt (histidine-containing phosphotransfer) domain-containing protein
MAALHRRFLCEVEADLRVCSQALTEGESELLRQTAHRLAGRGGMFGYPELSEAAGDLEEAILAHRGSEKVTALLGELMNRLEELLRPASHADE